MELMTIDERGYQFALSIYQLQRILRQRNCEPALSCNQLLRAGSSVRANLAEAEVAYSKAGLAAQMCIALKDLKEVEFWLRLRTDTNHLPSQESASYMTQAKELAKILYVSIRNPRKQSG